MGRGYPFQIGKRYVSVPDDPSLFDDPIQVEIRLLSTILHDQAETITTESNIFHRGQLLSNNTAWPTLSPVLSTLGLPINDQIPMINEISTSTREVDAIRTCHGRRIMPEIILLIGMDIDDEDDPMDVAMAESMESGTFHQVPATMASIKALEKVVLDGSDHCTICLDEFCVGSVVTRMPCSHVYHPDCIVEWLKTSNLCPLCRFRMPS